MAVLFVHGLWDKPTQFMKMRRVLQEHGVAPIQTATLGRNNGTMRIEELASSLPQAAAQLKQRSGRDQIDVVAFSRGGIIARYWMQRLGGASDVRRFISISAPHQGSVLARFGFSVGIRQLQPKSALLEDLNRDVESSLRGIEQHCIRTPLDLLIIPSASSQLPHATQHAIWVPAHQLMVSDRRVIDTTVALLTKD